MEHSSDLTTSVIIPYFNFFLFVAAFCFFFGKPLKAMALSRRQKFLAASKEAAATLQSAQKQFKELKDRFDVIDGELEAFKRASENLAKEEAAKLIAEGERLSVQIALEIKSLAMEEIARARFELRQEIVLAAAKSAEQKIEQNLDVSEKARILAGRMVDLRAFQV